MTISRCFTISIVLIAILILSLAAIAQTTKFTYQGKLLDNGLAPTGPYDLEFRLFDAATGGTQLGSTVTLTNVQVRNATFAVDLDFGANYPGATRFLEIAVKKPVDATFTTLTPRQPFKSAPYSVRSLNSAGTDSITSVCSGCVTASQIGGVNGSAVTGAIPIGSFPAGSSNYIQNGTTQQSASDFNISGTGTANIINATTQYNIGFRVLGIPGTRNTFVDGGFSNTTGKDNTFFGFIAGETNITASENTYFGSSAASQPNPTNVSASNAFFGYNTGINSFGSRNSFFGAGAGRANSLGSDNSYFGSDTGANNLTGSNNSFFGSAAGLLNTTGSENAFFGDDAGVNNRGDDNAFFGFNSGVSNTFGAGNSFFGLQSGSSNNGASFNAYFGWHAGSRNASATGNVAFGWDAGEFNTANEITSFGALAGATTQTGTANAFFGKSAGENNRTGSNNAFFGKNTGIVSFTIINNAFFGAFAGEVNNSGGGGNTFFGSRAGTKTTNGGDHAFFGAFAGQNNTGGLSNTFFGASAGSNNLTGPFNAFFGESTGSTNVAGGNNTLSGAGANVGSDPLFFATAIGSSAVATTNNQIQLGRDGSDTVRIGKLDAATATQVCFTATNVLAACSSSRRYKENIQPFVFGLDLIKRLEPVTYDWIGRNEHDLGLIAEDVATVEPLLVTHNRSGEIQGVKYDQLTVVLINAVNEQQAQISKQIAVSREQAATIKRQEGQINDQSSILKEHQRQLDTLKKIVCAKNPAAEPCKQ